MLVSKSVEKRFIFGVPTRKTYYTLKEFYINNIIRAHVRAIAPKTALKDGRDFIRRREGSAQRRRQGSKRRRAGSATCTGSITQGKRTLAEVEREKADKSDSPGPHRKMIPV